MSAGPERLFAFRLALALGEVNVDEMLRRMPAELLGEWMAYEELEPFGQRRGDLQAGIVASTLMNIFRDRKKRSQAFKPGDFILQFGESQAEPKPSKRKQSPNEMKSILDRIFKR